VQRKRVFLFFLLSFALTGIFLYEVLPTVLYRPRKDPVPFGAYVVPWIRLSHSFNEITMMTHWEIGDLMPGALKFEMTFGIQVHDGTRDVPSTVYLGHDKDLLYIGGKFREMGMNPDTSNETTLANYFRLFLDANNDGSLTFPESGSSMDVWVNPGANWRTELVSTAEDEIWTYSTLSKRFVWMRGEEYYQPHAQPAFAVENYDMMYYNATGTVEILMCKFLRSPATSEINALQMRSGERWVVGFLFELGYNRWTGLYSDYVDGWPRKTYPYFSNDSSWWPKLAIDLSNPPSGFQHTASALRTPARM
jgi:hypothetical protein